MKLAKVYALTTLLSVGVASAAPMPVYPSLIKDLFTATIPKNNVQAGMTALAHIFLVNIMIAGIAKGFGKFAEMKKPLKNIYKAITATHQKKYTSEFIKHPSEILGSSVSLAYVQEILKEEDGLWLALDKDTLIPASQVKSFIKEECKKLLASAGIGISLIGLAYLPRLLLL